MNRPNRTVAGLDVHKDSVFLCVVNDSGKIFECKYGVLTPDLDRMSSDMQRYGVSELAMESTSIYWMPIWRVLEEMFDQKLVNPYFIKQLPGRKTDVKDAEWIATCVYKELIRGSYVPDLIIQELRQYDRRIFDLNKEIVYKLVKLDACLQRCNIRISNYVSTIDSKSYKGVVEQLSQGITDPEELIKCIFLNKFSYTQVTVRKKNKMKVQVAIARKILVAIWHMFTKDQDYIDILKIES